MIPCLSRLSERRQRFSEQIARERAELGAAYRDLSKPFQYAETGLSGLRFLRKSGWLLALAPPAVNLAFSLLGWEKKGKKLPNWLARFQHQATHEVERIEKEEVPRIRKPLARWAKRGWSLFKVYRKVRPFFP